MNPAAMFIRFARWASRRAGYPQAFAAAMLIVLVWAVSGPLFGFSTTWQLMINTGTTIVTFLMVFLIQNTQNRDTDALQLKLDELIRATKGAHNAMLGIEESAEEELAEIKKTYEALARETKEGLQRGQIDTGTPEVSNGEVKSKSK
ncbi:MAG: low affinity iron permease family protein [SAR202 cluster bacterium]|nr:low affinity iron permease family protein [SAR202 cluster bacterium]